MVPLDTFDFTPRGAPKSPLRVLMENMEVNTAFPEPFSEKGLEYEGKIYSLESIKHTASTVNKSRTGTDIYKFIGVRKINELEKYIVVCVQRNYKKNPKGMTFG